MLEGEGEGEGEGVGPEVEGVEEDGAGRIENLAVPQVMSISPERAMVWELGEPLMKSLCVRRGSVGVAVGWVRPTIFTAGGERFKYG